MVHLIDYMRRAHYAQEKAEWLREAWKRSDERHVWEIREWQHFALRPPSIWRLALSLYVVPDPEDTPQLQDAKEFVKRMYYSNTELWAMGHSPTPPRSREISMCNMVQVMINYFWGFTHPSRSRVDMLTHLLKPTTCKEMIVNPPRSWSQPEDIVEL